VIPGTSFLAGADKRVGLDELRKDFTKDGFKVMGEIGLQYQGLSPSDPSVDQYFALAEELDVPVAIHMGTGGSGRANVTRPTFRGSMGNPLLLEDLLARHPKLRVQVMHAGYPMIDNMLTAPAGQLPRLRGRGRADLELSAQGSESLHRADRGRRVRQTA
jgi:predicted TIM-barrel fold metal-dependent hydrolase